MGKRNPLINYEPVPERKYRFPQIQEIYETGLKEGFIQGRDNAFLSIILSEEWEVTARADAGQHDNKN